MNTKGKLHRMADKWASYAIQERESDWGPQTMICLDCEGIGYGTDPQNVDHEKGCDVAKHLKLIRKKNNVD